MGSTAHHHSPVYGAQCGSICNRCSCSQHTCRQRRLKKEYRPLRMPKKARLHLPEKRSAPAPVLLSWYRSQEAKRSEPGTSAQQLSGPPTELNYAC